MLSRDKWVYRGIAGHLCVSNWCRFHIVTDIGDFRVSTIGAYYPGKADKMETVGCDRHYETMVFPIEDGQITNLLELDLDGLLVGPDPYETDKLAEIMHEKMCVKYANKYTKSGKLKKK